MKKKNILIIVFIWLSLQIDPSLHLFETIVRVSGSFEYSVAFCTFRDLSHNDIAFIEDGTLTVMSSFNFL